jgi:hypothetical protein
MFSKLLDHFSTTEYESRFSLLCNMLLQQIKNAVYFVKFLDFSSSCCALSNDLVCAIVNADTKLYGAYNII